MQSPDYYRNKEQTYLKHFFLEKYLETVAFHIGYTQGEFIYVDCFSGPWQSADEEFADTSIRISLDRLNYVREGLAAKERYPDIRAVFIEKSAEAFTALQRALRTHGHAVRTVAFPGTFEENIPGILREVGSAFAFFFIDPKGWTGFAMEEIRPILLHEPGEVMVNFMYDFVNRFLNFPSEANEESLDRLFGTPRWREIRGVADRETASVNLYMEQLRAAGAFTYVTSTRILKPLSDRAYFHLIYATRNPKGILKFRDVEKKIFTEQETVGDTAQREDREARSRQREIVFAPAGELPHSRQAERAGQLHKAEAKIRELVRQGPLAYETLQPLILELPLVWNTDLNKILMVAHRNAQLVIQGLGPRQRSPKQGNLIRLP
ncbi:MAG: three-Cys-motif partner protein TcmP [Bryobacteraceae bacterium]